MDRQEEYDEIPGELTREELEAKLEEAKERLARYEGYQKLMEETGASQLSIKESTACRTDTGSLCVSNTGYKGKDCAPESSR